MSKLFASMKKNTQESLNAVLDSEKKGNYEDTRLWRATTDKSGNGSAVIRFLPASANNKTPFVKMFSHGFQGSSGLWYIENSLTTIGKPDPVGDANTALWQCGENSPERVLVQGVNSKNARKRKLNYYANVMVIKDPANPENNGKVFLFKFGAKIHDKIMAKLKPIYEDDKPSLVYDFWQGSNFKLKIKKKDGQTNYDDCEWDSPTPLLDGDDAKLEALWNTQHNLDELIAEDKFKSYDELKAHFIKVVGNDDRAMILTGWADGTTGHAARPEVSEDAPVARSKAPVAQPTVEDDIPFDVDAGSAEDFFNSLED